MKIPIGLKKAATMCILKSGKHFLLLKRNNEPNKNMYTPVGGKLEPYEDPLSCAIRETKEETGIEVSRMTYHGMLTESSPTKYNWICYVYSAEVPMQEPSHCDEGTLKWVHYDDILSLPTPKTDWWIYKFVLEQRTFALNAHADENLNLISMIEEIKSEKLL